MRVLDPGHVYALAHLDGISESVLTFVKREGPGYPGNVGHHEGTNLQEVLRALISRVQYLNAQISDDRNVTVLILLRGALRELEIRAAERHGRRFVWPDNIGYEIETAPVCEQCGHIGCDGRHHAPPGLVDVAPREEQ